MANLESRSKRIIIEEKYEQQIDQQNSRLLNKYIMDMELRELSKRTIYNYRCDLIQWMSYMVKEQFGLLAENATTDDIEEFIYFCVKSGNNVNRIKGRLSAISSFYKYLKKKRIVKENPVDFIDRPKKGLPVVVQTFLTLDQYKHMGEVLKSCGDLQLYVYMMFSISTMARATAVSSIRWEQINFEDRTVDDVLEKEGYITTLFFSEEVSDSLKKLKAEREEKGIDDGGYLFVSKRKVGNMVQYKPVTSNTLGNWAKKIGEMCDIPTLHPHDFRHSGSQLLHLNGMPVEDISELLNHKGVDVTIKHYLKQDKKRTKENKDKFSF